MKNVQIFGCGCHTVKMTRCFLIRIESTFNIEYFKGSHNEPNRP
ncbi:hypothetical protein QWZ13_12725 [Reinekea marina]|nr:hypothetical protein [Reinekea marina]MDN3649777.1 hypothetical protein [Reinekea marina]